MEAMTLGRAVKESRGGASFEAFEGIARRDLKSIARGAWARRPMPPGVDLEDVYQEVLLAASIALKDWDGRGELEAYVAWRARNAASRWVSGQRNAARRSAHAPSRFPAALSTILPPDTDHEIAMPAREAQQERTVELAREIERARARLGARDRALLDLLVRERLSAESVAARIKAEPGLRRRLGMSGDQAQRSVATMIRRAWPDLEGRTTA